MLLSYDILYIDQFHPTGFGRRVNFSPWSGLEPDTAGNVRTRQYTLVSSNMAGWKILYVYIYINNQCENPGKYRSHIFEILYTWSFIAGQIIEVNGKIFQ